MPGFGTLIGRSCSSVASEGLLDAVDQAVRRWLLEFSPGSSRTGRDSALGGTDVRARRVGGYRWLPWCLERGINPVDCAQVREALPGWAEHLDALVTRGVLSEHTVYTAWQAARSWHRWLSSETGISWACTGLYGQMPRYVWLAEPQRRLPAEVLTLGEIARLIEATGRTGGSRLNRLRTDALVRLLVATGARISELAGMRREDVSPYGQPPRARWVTKGARRREAVLPESCAVALRRYFLARQVGTRHLVGDEPVFASIEPGPVVWQPVSTTVLQDRLTELARMAGLGKRVTAHRIRASLITAALDDGIPIWDVMAWSGHRSEAAVRAYDRRRPGEQVGRHLAEQVAAASA